jgi:hypothetical protein
MSASGSIWGGHRLDAVTIRNRDDLVAVVRRRQDDLKVPCLAIDEITGLASGHFSKLTCRTKGFGFMSSFHGSE